MPKKPDKLKKEQLTLETVFNNGGRSGQHGLVYIYTYVCMYVCVS